MRIPVVPARKDEVRFLLRMSEQEVISKAGGRLTVCESLPELHNVFAKHIAEAIISSARENKNLNCIMPVGPVGQYRVLAEIVKRENLSLKHCRFFFMDEYCIDGKAVPSHHPLSFKGILMREFIRQLPPTCGLKEENIFFPDENNINFLEKTIEDAGGIDICFGGIGIHGHLAFNEPETGVAEKDPRMVELNDFTVTINAIRAQVGGNIECFPRFAFTVGMRQILSAKKIFLYCRNGYEFDWANTVLRLALFGKPGDDYPVTHIRNKDYHITTDKDTLRTPKNIL